MTKTMKRCRAKRVDPEVNRGRLLKILQANLEQATEPDLRRRLVSAIERLRERAQ